MFLSTTSFVVFILLLVASDRSFGFRDVNGSLKIFIVALVTWTPFLKPTKKKKPYLLSVHYVTRTSPLRGMNWLRLPLRYDLKSVSDVVFPTYNRTARILRGFSRGDLVLVVVGQSVLLSSSSFSDL